MQASGGPGALCMVLSVCSDSQDEGSEDPSILAKLPGERPEGHDKDCVFCSRLAPFGLFFCSFDFWGWRSTDHSQLCRTW
eukprot:700466-Amphidinium_carterae.1